MSIFLHDIPFDLFLKYYKDNNKNFVSSNSRYQPVQTESQTSQYYTSYYKYTYSFFNKNENNNDLYPSIKYVYLKISNILTPDISQYNAFNKIFDVSDAVSKKIEFVSSTPTSKDEIQNQNTIPLYKAKISNSFLSYFNNLTTYKYFATINNKFYPFISFNAITNKYQSFLFMYESDTEIDITTIPDNSWVEVSLPNDIIISSNLYLEGTTKEKYYPVYDKNNTEIGKIYEFDPYYINKTIVTDNIANYYFTDTYTGKEVSFTEENIPLSPLMRYHNYMRKYKNLLVDSSNAQHKYAELFFEDSDSGYKIKFSYPIYIQENNNIESFDAFKFDNWKNNSVILTNKIKSNESGTTTTNITINKVTNSVPSMIQPNNDNIIYSAATDKIDEIYIVSEDSIFDITKPISPAEKIKCNVTHYFIDQNDILNINTLTDSNIQKFLLSIISPKQNETVNYSITDSNVISYLLNYLKESQYTKCNIEPVSGNYNELKDSIIVKRIDKTFLNTFFPNTKLFFITNDNINIFVAMYSVVYSKNTETNTKSEKLTFVSLGSFINNIIKLFTIDYSDLTNSKYSTQNEFLNNIKNYNVYYDKYINFSELKEVTDGDNTITYRVVTPSIKKNNMDAKPFFDVTSATQQLISGDNAITVINSDITSIRKIFKKNSIYKNASLSLNTPVSDNIYSTELQQNLSTILNNIFVSSYNIYPITSISNLSTIFLYVNSIYSSIPSLLKRNKKENTGISYYSYNYKTNKFGFIPFNELNIQFDSVIQEVANNKKYEKENNLYYDYDEYYNAAHQQVVNKNVFDRLFNFAEYSINLQEINDLIKQMILQNKSLSTISSNRLASQLQTETGSLYHEKNNSLSNIINQFIELYTNYIYDDSANNDFYISDYTKHFKDKIEYKYNSLIPTTYSSNYNIRYRFTGNEEINKNILLSSLKIKKNNAE